MPQPLWDLVSGDLAFGLRIASFFFWHGSCFEYFHMTSCFECFHMTNCDDFCIDIVHIYRNYVTETSQTTTFLSLIAWEDPKETREIAA